jgi:hypothetical protein
VDQSVSSNTLSIYAQMALVYYRVYNTVYSVTAKQIADQIVELKELNNYASDNTDKTAIAFLFFGFQGKPENWANNFTIDMLRLDNSTLKLHYVGSEKKEDKTYVLVQAVISKDGKAIVSKTISFLIQHFEAQETITNNNSSDLVSKVYNQLQRLFVSGDYLTFDVKNENSGQINSKSVEDADNTNQIDEDDKIKQLYIHASSNIVTLGREQNRHQLSIDASGNWKCKVIMDDAGILPPPKWILVGTKDDLINISCQENNYKELRRARIKVQLVDNPEIVIYIKVQQMGTNEEVCIQYPNGTKNVIINQNEEATFGYAGMYADNFSYETKEDGSFYVSFDVYNKAAILGYAQVYDENGDRVKEQQTIIEMYTPNISSFTEWLESGERLIKDAINIYNGDFYKMNSKKTAVYLKIPKGGYLSITNDISKSNVCALIDCIELITRSLSISFSPNDYTPSYEKIFADKFDTHIISQIKRAGNGDISIEDVQEILAFVSSTVKKEQIISYLGESAGSLLGDSIETSLKKLMGGNRNPGVVLYDYCMQLGNFYNIKATIIDMIRTYSSNEMIIIKSNIPDA